MYDLTKTPNNCTVLGHVRSTKNAIIICDRLVHMPSATTTKTDDSSTDKSYRYVCVPVHLVCESTEDLGRLAGSENTSTDHRVVPAGLARRLLHQLLNAHWRNVRLRRHRQ